LPGPGECLVDSLPGQAGGGLDGDKEGGLVAAGAPGPGLCGVEIIDPHGGALPGEPGDRGHLVARLERGRGHGDHRERRDAQERGQEPVGVVVPGGGPGDVEDVPELADPFSVRRAQADWFFSGEQVVFGEPFVPEC